MSSYVDPEVNTEFPKFSNKKCGAHAEVKATCGDTHDCLGMSLIFQDGKLIVDMIE